LVAFANSSNSARAAGALPHPGKTRPQMLDTTTEHRFISTHNKSFLRFLSHFRSFGMRTNFHKTPSNHALGKAIQVDIYYSSARSSKHCPMTGWAPPRTWPLPVDLVWTPQAREDLIDIYACIGLDNPSAAERILNAIEAKAKLLIEYPRLGVQRPDIRPSTRILIEGPHITLCETQGLTKLTCVILPKSRFALADLHAFD